MSVRKILMATATAPKVAWDLAYAYYHPPANLAWDIATSRVTRNFTLTRSGSPQSIFFKPDGTVMYILSSLGDAVEHYNLSIAWDVNSAVYLKNFSVAAEETAPTGVFFKPDGTAMYIIGTTGDDVNQYALSTAWDISTATYLQNFSVAAQDLSPQDIFFKNDGTVMYMLGGSGDDVSQYTLSTAWDISTATYLTRYLASTQLTTVVGLFFDPHGGNMYISGLFNDGVNPSIIRVSQYNLGAFSVAAQELTPSGVFFKPDGTAMYIIGNSGDEVNQYTLSTAWDISTATYLQNFLVNTQETIPIGIFFKPDGTAMYIIGQSGDDVNQYALSTAWDITTATYLQNFSVAAQELTPAGVFFKPDGTVMYMLGASGDDVNQYTLSTAWDISTATYLQNFSVQMQDTNPEGIFFKPDGTVMYMLGSSGDDVYQYSLSIQR
jgi:sugar lactone lactonase YvrE